jgi:hypothetical protein
MVALVSASTRTYACNAPPFGPATARSRCERRVRSRGTPRDHLHFLEVRPVGRFLSGVLVAYLAPSLRASGGDSADLIAGGLEF